MSPGELGELDEYGMPVVHYKRPALVQAHLDETARLTRKMEVEAKSAAEWRAYREAKAAAIERFEAEWAEREKSAKAASIDPTETP